MVTNQNSIEFASRIRLPSDEIVAFCAKWRVRDLSLFGSILRNDFDEKSDVDVLIDLAPGVALGLFAVEKMKRELEHLFGRRVDIITRLGIEISPDAAQWKSVLENAKSIYVAA